MHAKTFVVNGALSCVGKMNFDDRSLTLNDELALLGLDPAFGGWMAQVLVDDLLHSREIELAEFRRRAWTERVGEWGQGS